MPQRYFGAVHAKNARAAAWSSFGRHNFTSRQEAQLHQAPGNLHRKVQPVQDAALTHREIGQGSNSGSPTGRRPDFLFKKHIGPFQYEIPGDVLSTHVESTSEFMSSWGILGLNRGILGGENQSPTRCYHRPVLRDGSQHPTLAPQRETGSSFTRKEVCRLLKIEGRQLRSWERQQLIPELSVYRFSDLLSLKTIIRLRSENVHPRLIRQALAGLHRRLKDMPDGMNDVRVYREGRGVRVQIGKQKMEPVSGQLLFNFPEAEISRLLQLPPSQKGSADMAEKLRNKIEADRWFEQGLELERRGAPLEQIVDAYQKAAELDKTAAGPLVNLGTVFFNGHAWSDAEEQYKKALTIDPNYPLAHFNLGNLYDEQGDPETALSHYLEALRLQPNYADAHYNLALLHQGEGDVMSAMRHWRAYLKLDGGSEWGHIARRELAKMEAATVVRGAKAVEPRLRLVEEKR